MYDYFNAILKQYPNIKKEDFTLSDDGDGVVYISRWEFAAAAKPNLNDLKQLANTLYKETEYKDTITNNLPSIEQRLNDLWNDINDALIPGKQSRFYLNEKAIRDRHPKTNT